MDPIHTLALNLTARCNARCAFCAYWHDHADLPEVRDFAPFYQAITDAARLSPSVVVALTGGEPFLVPEVFPLARHAKASGARKVVVTTNGLAVPDAYIAEFGGSVDELIVSLDGFAATHDRLRGVPGAFRRVTELIGRVHAEPVHPDTLVLAVISAANLEEFRDFVTWAAADRRIARIVLQAITQPMPAPSDARWHERSDLWPRDPEKTDALLDWLIEHRAPLRIHNEPAQLATMKRYFRDPGRLVWQECTVGTRYLAVLTDGRVLNCVSRPAIGNINERPLAEILAAPSTAGRLAEMAACRLNCHFLVNCGFAEGELA
jgi:MoaA/NifB/PqqE/SkfB family radical SAM enzyme